MKTPFLKPRLAGPRFDEHSVPLELLKDWAAFEELILETARHLYLDQHPERQRVQRGFADGFALHLTGVEEGSARPVIQRIISPTLLPHPEGDIFDQARNLVLSVIAAIAMNQPIPEKFPVDLLGYFDEFGQSLRDDERIEFVLEGSAQKIVYDREVRKKLAFRAGKSEYRAAADLRGWITGVNAENQTYTLRRISGSHVTGKFGSELRVNIMKALDEYSRDKESGTGKVLVRGVAVYDKLDRPSKIETSIHIEPVDQNDVPARIEELALINDGWLDGKGVSPQADGLKWLASVWEHSFPNDLPNPFVYPTPDGGVQLEWTMGAWELSAELDLSKRYAVLIGQHTDGDVSLDLEANLATPEGWSVLSNFVRERQVGDRRA